MSYFDTFKKRLTESKEPEDNFNLVSDDIEDIDEASVSSMAGPYDTPNAFGKLSDDDIEMLGYKKVKKPKTSTVKESEYKKLSSELFLKEASYHSYKKDGTFTAKQKVNRSISTMNTKLRELEQIVNHNVRLKQESGVDNSQYWKSSRENLSKISERLLRVSKQLKELAS